MRKISNIILMTTLLYHWNFTGDGLSVGDTIKDSEADLEAEFKTRGTVNSSSFSRTVDGIILNNNDSTNGGYYIELVGLNSTKLGGNISIEMVIQNHDRSYKALYFSSVNSAEETTSNGASLVARFNGNTKFLARPDATSEVTYSNYRNVNESGTTVINSDNEFHYIFSVHYDSSGSSLKIYINGDKKGENNADLEMILKDTIRGSNIIGTHKNPTNATYLNGVVKYLKIYQNSMSDEEATSIYNNYISRPYWSDYSSKSNSEKYIRRHTKVATYFTDNSTIDSFEILGNQLGLENSSEIYKIHKFINNTTIEISDNYNYIPISGQNQFIIVKYNNNYFKITQTSAVSSEDSKYKCEISIGNSNNFIEQCSNKGFDDTFTYGNLILIFGGLEININNNQICFHQDTIIQTDQGKIKIKDLKSEYTINNSPILYLLSSKNYDKNLVLIKKNAFGLNKPQNDIKLTKNHLIFYENKLITISKLIDDENVILIENDKKDIYNIILLNNNFISVYGIMLNVFGIDDLLLKKIESSFKNGNKSYTLNFSDNSQIKIDLDKFKNF